MFETPQVASRFELQGCIYSYVTPNSQIKINIFQSALGKKVPNGIEILEFLRPIRELLKTDQVKDIKQLIQRELDDQRIIKSLVPYLLNETNREVAFFPSVLGVLMPKDYLNNINGIYPYNSASINEINSITKEFFLDETFHWSIKTYKSDDTTMPYSILTVDKNTCDIVVVDGQHRTNAFRAVNNKLTSDNVVIKEIYKDISFLPTDSDVTLPITLLWFENLDTTSNSISPEIISRKLFIDVNNSAKSIATSRKILLDDRNPLHLMTNHFYSVIASRYNFKLDNLSLAHLGCDVVNEVAQQSTYESMPFTYISTPERIKYVCDVFFMRKKNYEINATGIRSPQARKSKYASSKIDNEYASESNQLINFFTKSNQEDCIAIQRDEYLEVDQVYIREDLAHSGKPKQQIVREEFEDLYFNCFYLLFSEFKYFNEHKLNIKCFNEEYINNPATPLAKRESWKSAFLLGQSMYFTLSKSSNNLYKEALSEIQSEFQNKYLNADYTDYLNNTIKDKDLFLSFRTLAFQIGYFEAFYQYCKSVKNCDFSTVEGNDILLYCREFLDLVNKIENNHWVNYFTLVRDLQGEMHPKYFPVMTHLILRKIQPENHIFNCDDNWYFAPECVYFHEKTMERFIKFISDNFTPVERKTLKIMDKNDILEKTVQGKKLRLILEDILNEFEESTKNVFKFYLGFENTYLDIEHNLTLLKEGIEDNFKNKIELR